MTQKIEDKVKFLETDRIKMTAFLNKRGYDTVMETPQSSDLGKLPEKVGILRGNKPQSILFDIIRVKRDYIGQLLLGLKSGGDGLYHSMSTCTINVYGRQYVSELKSLATDISKVFNSEVSVELVAEEPLKETLPWR